MRSTLLSAAILALVACGSTAPAPHAAAARPAPEAAAEAAAPAAGRRGMVVAEEALAARVGQRVLAAGGNAVDAAVATTFALAVTHPAAGNLGGGGFAVVRLAGGEVAALDFREAAPGAATADMYLGPDGKVTG